MRLPAPTKRHAYLPPELSENKQLLKHLPDSTVKRVAADVSNLVWCSGAQHKMPSLARKWRKKFATAYAGLLALHFVSSCHLVCGRALAELLDFAKK